jgi:hypothetical protein
VGKVGCNGIFSILCACLCSSCMPCWALMEICMWSTAAAWQQRDDCQFSWGASTLLSIGTAVHGEEGAVAPLSERKQVPRLGADQRHHQTRPLEMVRSEPSAAAASGGQQATHDGALPVPTCPKAETLLPSLTHPLAMRRRSTKAPSKCGACCGERCSEFRGLVGALHESREGRSAFSEMFRVLLICRRVSKV